MMDSITPLIGDTYPHFDGVIIDNWIAGINSGPLPLLAGPVTALDAATKGYVDTTVSEFVTTTNTSPPTNPMPNQLWYSSTDGQLYIYYQDPNSAQWVIANNTGIQDAPGGTVAYARQNGIWVAALPLAGGIMTGPLVLANDPTAYFMAATKGYVDVTLRNYLPLTGGTVSGQLLLTQDPTVAHGAATKNYVDTHGGLVTVSDVPPTSPLAGELWFDSRGVQLYIWYIDGGNATWVQTNAPAFTEGSAGGPGGGGAGFPEAPVTGRIYGRNGLMQSWVPVLPLVAGSANALAGPLFLANNAPMQDNEAASKRFVEDAVATGSLWQGGYIVATNTPDLTAVFPLLNGYSWTAITQNPIIPEPMPIDLPGIPVGTMVYNGDLLRWDENNGVWFEIRGSGITRNEADALYVLRSGDMMTGDLFLAQDPTQALEAATKQYVDSTTVVVSSLPPGAPFEGQLWYDLANPNLYVWVVDPTSAQWVIAVNPGNTTPALPFTGTNPRAPDFEFPPNPADGDIVTSPTGAQFRWNAAANRWGYVPPEQHFVNLTGDTMTGWLNIEGAENAAVVFKKMQVGPGPFFDAQWGIGADWTGNALAGTGFKIVRFDPQGNVIDAPITISEIDSTILIGGEGINLDGKLLVRLPDPTFDHQATPKSYVDTKVATTGDNMTGALQINVDALTTPLIAVRAEYGNVPALIVAGGNRNATGMGVTASPQIALHSPVGGRPQWISSWTDVGGGAGVTAEAIGFYTNSHVGGIFPTHALFCGGFNSASATQGRFIAPFGSAALPGLIFGNGPSTGTFTIDAGTGFWRAAANTISVSTAGVELLRFNANNLGMYKCISFGSTAQTSPQDLSRHIDLWGGTFGFSITSATLNYNVPNGSAHATWVGTTERARVHGGGLTVNGGISVNGGIDVTGGNINMGNRYITNVLTGSSGGDAASKLYVDNAVTSKVTKAGDSMSGQLTISRGNVNSIGLELNECYLRLYKNNTTTGQSWPSINWAVPSGRDNWSNAEIAVRQSGNFSYYGTIADFEFYVTRGGYGRNRALWTSGGAGVLVNFNVAGDVYARGAMLTSDASLKEDISPLVDVDAAFDALRPIRFKWRPPMVEAPLAAPEGRMPAPRVQLEKLNYGLLADSVMPDATEMTERGRAYDLAAVVAVLVAKVKQLEARLAS